LAQRAEKSSITPWQPCRGAWLVLLHYFIHVQIIVYALQIDSVRGSNSGLFAQLMGRLNGSEQPTNARYQQYRQRWWRCFYRKRWGYFGNLYVHYKACGIMLLGGSQLVAKVNLIPAFIGLSVSAGAQQVRCPPRLVNYKTLAARAVSPSKYPIPNRLPTKPRPAR